MTWYDKLERRFGNLYIPNLMIGVVLVQGAVWLLQRLMHAVWITQFFSLLLPDGSKGRLIGHPHAREVAGSVMLVVPLAVLEVELQGYEAEDGVFDVHIQLMLPRSSGVVVLLLELIEMLFLVLDGLCHRALGKLLRTGQPAVILPPAFFLPVLLLQDSASRTILL